jgi:hypothetical protein
LRHEDNKKKEYIIENSADGNCLFESLSQIKYNTKKYHMKIRKKICDFIHDRINKLEEGLIKYYKNNEKEYEPDAPVGSTSASALLDYNLITDLYNARQENVTMRGNGVYGGINEIYAASLLYHVDIEIYETSKSDQDEEMLSLRLIYPDGTSKGVYKLHYSTLVFKGGHYEAILPKIPGSESTSSSQESESESLIRAIYAGNEQLKKIALQLKELKITDQEIVDNLPTYTKHAYVNTEALIGQIFDARDEKQKVYKSTKTKTIKASSRTRSNSPKTKTIKASSRTRSNSPKTETRKASPPRSRSNSPKGTTITAATSLSRSNFNSTRRSSPSPKPPPPPNPPRKIDTTSTGKASNASKKNKTFFGSIGSFGKTLKNFVLKKIRLQKNKK